MKVNFAPNDTCDNDDAYLSLAEELYAVRNFRLSM